jgi:fructose-bisphosphate aldolase class I
MNIETLKSTANELMNTGRGLLAMDESLPTCNKRFAKLGIPQTEEYRHAYRELIATTPGLGDSISGAILFDETIRQTTRDGKPFVELLKAANIVPGIKLDLGAVDFPAHNGEKVTEGLDGLRQRIEEYAKMGARFAKWRAVITIGDGIPSKACLAVNASVLARYAGLCQEADIVPIVEPEVLMDGNHSLEQCAEATYATLLEVFEEIHLQNVVLEGMILKPNMVLPGLESPTQQSVDEVADVTVNTFLRTVPAAVPGIAFLSGGQSAELASARLNAMNTRFKGRMPWALTFSYSRAIQQPALELWKGDPANIPAAQKALAHRAHLNKLARAGQYTESLEK